MKKIILIDNYDSFTYNLLHYMGEVGAEIEVFRNDQITADELLAKEDIGGIVISPGPCTPNESGICMEIIEKAKGNFPVLGVCLGHEAIGQNFGAKIVRTNPMHGKVSSINHNGKDIFTDIKTPFEATRYHSLIIERESLPDCFEITAHTDDNIIMAIRHKQYDIFGVQFHPESIASEYGHEILKNFLDLAK